MKKIGFLLLAVLALASCGGGSSYDANNDYQVAQMTVEDRERAYPLDFLSATGTYKKNIIGEWVVEGSITSTATQITYKDVVVKVDYYTKTESFLGSESFTIYEFYSPNTQREFKIKSAGYANAELIGLSVDGASYQ